MKIAVMVNSLMKIGGVAKHAILLSREFAAMGHQVTVWAVEYDKEHCYPELTHGLEVRSLRNTHRTYPSVSRIPGLGMIAGLYSYLAAYQDQKKLVREMPKGYDVVNPHGNLIIWAAAEYKRKHSVPVVWMCNDFWPPMGTNKPKPSSSILQKSILLVKKIYSVPITTYDRAAVHQIDKIAVLSERVKLQMMEYYKVDPCIVRAGVEVSKFAQGDGLKIRSHNKIKNNAFLLLSVSLLMPRRRLEDVIQAIKILIDHGENVYYLVVGLTSQNPDYFQRLQAEVADCNLAERVKFVGEVTDVELQNFYHACDAFIWASDENQSWGLAAMEAMSAGKPVIVSRANGLAEVLENEKTALIVPPRSPDQIADAVRRLVEDRSLAESIARGGKRLMCESYTWRKNAEGMLALFEEAIAKTNARKSPSVFHE